MLLEGLGLETVARVNRPATPGARFCLRITHLDVPLGQWRMEDVPDHQADEAQYAVASAGGQ